MDSYLKDVLSQADIMRTCLGHYLDDANQGILDRVVRGGKRRILFCGMGSSNYSSYPALMMLNSHGFDARMESASQILHYQLESITPATLVVLVSQSGESGEIVQLIKRLSSDIEILAITNFPDSTLGLRANYSLLMHLEPEEAVSTRTYMASLILSSLLASALIRASLSDYQQRVTKVLDGLGSIIERRSDYEEQMAAFLGQPHALCLIGRGYSLSTVRAGALFIRECSKFPALDFDSGEFRHGPFEIVDSTFSGIIFAPDGPCHELQVRMARDIVAREGKVVLISGRKTEFDNPRCLIIETGRIEEPLSPLVDMVPVQLYARQLAQFRGFVPGKFRWSSKVTNRE